MKIDIAKSSFILFLFFVVIFYVADVHAECSNERCVGKITRLYTHSGTNTVYIGTDGDEKQLQCQPTEGVYIILEPTKPLFHEIYSSLLSAAIRGIRTKVRVNTDGNKCRLIYVVVPY